MVSVAQLVRVPDCGSGGCEFDSRHSPHFFDGSLAQLAEHLTLNQGVTGSIPVRSTIFLPFYFYSINFQLKNKRRREPRISRLVSRLLLLYHFYVDCAEAGAGHVCMKRSLKNGTILFKFRL